MKLTRRGIWLIVLGVVSYLIFLLATFPASRAWALLGGNLPVQAYALTGTVWNGNAAVVQSGPRRLEAVSWDLALAPLLSGRLGADIKARLPGNGRLSGYLSSTASGATRGKDVRLDMAMADFLAWSGVQLPATAAGRFDVLLRQFAVNDSGQIQNADGLLSWHNAALQLGNRSVSLGEVALRLEPADDGVNGILVSQGGQLQADGKLKLTPDGRVAVDAALKATDQADDQTRQALALLGIPADGSPLQVKLALVMENGQFRMESLNR